MVAVNDESFEILRNEGKAGDGVSFRLVGEEGNRIAIGARVLIEGSYGKQMFELHAGGSYLSQSPVGFRVSGSKWKETKSIEVRWPDGTTSKASPDAVKDGLMTIEK